MNRHVHLLTFFFSSRRRHTRLQGDWSSDVCSSDLTNPLETALVRDGIRSEIGIDLSLGFQYRPFLTDNVIISTGFGTLLPGRGYKDIYRRLDDPVPGFNTHGDAGEADDFLYSGLMVVTLTF